jgi:hypothetical protein
VIYTMNSKGTAAVIGTTFFMVILFAVFANLLWYNQATVEMNEHLSTNNNKTNSEIQLETVYTPEGLSLRVSSLGSYESKIKGLWIVDDVNDYHDYLSEETLLELVSGSLIIPAGGSLDIKISEYSNYSFNGSIRYKVLTDLGNIAHSQQEVTYEVPGGVYWESRGDDLNDFNIQTGPGSSAQVVYLGGKPWIKWSIDDPTSVSDFFNVRCRAEAQISGVWNYQLDRVWYGVRYYIPDEWRVEMADPAAESNGFEDTCKISQLHEGDPSTSHYGGLTFWVGNDDQTLNINCGYASCDTIARDIPLIKNEPWTLMVYTSPTVIEYYINGQLVASSYGDHAMNPESPYTCRYFKVGIYCGLNQNAKYLYTSDHIVAENRAAIEAYFSN